MLTQKAQNTQNFRLNSNENEKGIRRSVVG